MTEPKNNKPKTDSGTPAGTGEKTTGIDINELMKQYQSMGGSVPQGPTFTTQDANAYVQNVYQQLLGRNAVGAERTKAINIFLNQGQTDASGRQEAIMSMVQETPEYRRQQENRYLDAIYGAVAQEVQEARR